MTIKNKLHALCVEYVKARIQASRNAISEAQQAANEETKSSAGDKYETGRAMAQLEIEKNTAQLAEALKLKQAIGQIFPDQSSSTVQAGSLVITNQGRFYISISVGQLKLDDDLYFIISPTSPIAKQLIGLKPQDYFTFQGKTFTVLEIT